MLLLAQATAPAFTASQLGAALAIVAFLGGLALVLKSLFAHQPPLHKEYATRAEVEKLEKKLEADSAKQASSRKGIYADLEEQGRDVAALKAEFGAVKGHLSNLDSKIDQVLLRLPRPKGQ